MNYLKFLAIFVCSVAIMGMEKEEPFGAKEYFRFKEQYRPTNGISPWVAYLNHHFQKVRKQSFSTYAGDLLSAIQYGVGFGANFKFRPATSEEKKLLLGITYTLVGTAKVNGKVVDQLLESKKPIKPMVDNSMVIKKAQKRIDQINNQVLQEAINQANQSGKYLWFSKKEDENKNPIIKFYNAGTGKTEEYQPKIDKKKHIDERQNFIDKLEEAKATYQSNQDVLSTLGIVQELLKSNTAQKTMKLQDWDLFYQADIASQIKGKQIADLVNEAYNYARQHYYVENAQPQGGNNAPSAKIEEQKPQNNQNGLNSQVQNFDFDVFKQPFTDGKALVKALQQASLYFNKYPGKGIIQSSSFDKHSVVLTIINDLIDLVEQVNNKKEVDVSSVMRSVGLRRVTITNKIYGDGLKPSSEDPLLSLENIQKSVSRYVNKDELQMEKKAIKALQKPIFGEEVYVTDWNHPNKKYSIDDIWKMIMDFEQIYGVKCSKFLKNFLLSAQDIKKERLDETLFKTMSNINVLRGNNPEIASDTPVLRYIYDYISMYTGAMENFKTQTKVEFNEEERQALSQFDSNITHNGDESGDTAEKMLYRIKKLSINPEYKDVANQLEKLFLDIPKLAEKVEFLKRYNSIGKTCDLYVKIDVIMYYKQYYNIKSFDEEQKKPAQNILKEDYKPQPIAIKNTASIFKVKDIYYQFYPKNKANLLKIISDKNDIQAVDELYKTFNQLINAVNGFNNEVRSLHKLKNIYGEKYYTINVEGSGLCGWEALGINPTEDQGRLEELLNIVMSNKNEQYQMMAKQFAVGAQAFEDALMKDFMEGDSAPLAALNKKTVKEIAFDAIKAIKDGKASNPNNAIGRFLDVSNMWEWVAKNFDVQIQIISPTNPKITYGEEGKPILYVSSDNAHFELLIPESDFTKGNIPVVHLLTELEYIKRLVMNVKDKSFVGTHKKNFESLLEKCKELEKKLNQ